MFFRKKGFQPSKDLVKPLLIILVFFVIVSIPGLSSYNHLELSMKIMGWVGFQENDLAGILIEILPGVYQDIHGSGLDYIHYIMTTFTSVDTINPASIISWELNLSLNGTAAAALSDKWPSVEEEGGEEDFYLPGQDGELGDWISIPVDELPPVELNGDPMIIIYNTHNGEGYKPSEGASRFDGKNAGIVEVAKNMGRAFESLHAIKTIQSDVIHDYPDFTKSYINSMRTVQGLLKKYPKVQVVIDVHRDAGLNQRSDTLVKINGKNYAKVMLVVGTEHPKWKDNANFAEKVVNKANELYPGLIKTTRLAKDRRYNQHLHPRALLMEFGSDLNTKEDANNSARLMAEVISAVLKGK